MDYEKAYKEALEKVKPLYERAKKDDNPIWATYESIFPQLRESEDERIRKVLLNLVSNDKVAGYTKFYEERGITCDDAIAYLEKQKEPENTSASTMIPSCWEVEQKPAEWNDTDMKEARDNLISVCRDWARGEQTTLLPIAAVRARYFLEHLTEPKPAEWSEEEEDMRLEAIRVLESGCERYRKESGCLPSWHKVINWLKSLRPQPKQEWSEEDEHMLVRTINLLEMQGNGGVDGTELRKSIDYLWSLFNRLKSLRPSWKPSYEQMEALRRAVNKLANTDVADSVRLSIMYDNLKKL